MNDNKNKELDRLNGVYKKLLANTKVDYHEGFGTVVDAHTVEVNGQRFTVSNAATSQKVSLMHARMTLLLRAQLPESGDSIS